MLFSQMMKNAYRKCVESRKKGFSCQFAHSMEEYDDAWEALKLRNNPELSASWNAVEEAADFEKHCNALLFCVIPKKEQMTNRIFNCEKEKKR